MSSQRQLERMINKAAQEITALRNEIAEKQTQVGLKEAYIQGLRDSLKYIPKQNEVVEPPKLRAGTDIAVAHEVLLKAGKALHVTEVLKLMGKEVNKKNRISIGGYMNFHSRRGMFFKKTAPNTFEAISGQTNGESAEEMPPDDFGTVKE